MHIDASARKHGVSDGDMLHAYRNHWMRIDTEDVAVTVLIGPSTTGEPLEIAVVSLGARTAIIHAMRARRKYLTGWWIR